MEALLGALKRRGTELGSPVAQDGQAYAPDGEIGPCSLRLTKADW
ncbi:hypothetical protein [Polymorphospora rubra]